MISGERKKCEMTVLALLDQNPQVSELYLQLLTAFESLPLLISFLLFHLTNKLFKTSHQLALLFSLCQLCEDPLLAERLGVYWPHEIEELELMLIYELVAEKNFREFITLPIAAIETKVVSLNAMRKVSMENIIDTLDKLILLPEEFSSCEPVRIENTHAFSPPENASFFEQTIDNEELLVRQANMLRFSPPFLPKLLLPEPYDLEISLISCADMFTLAPVLNPCLNTQCLITAPLRMLSVATPAERESLLELIRCFPQLVDEKLLLSRVEELVNENPSFTVEIMHLIAESRPNMFQAFTNQLP